MNLFYINVILFLIATEIIAQPFTISGKITDSLTNEALPYSNIRVLNTTSGTAANPQQQIYLVITK